MELTQLFIADLLSLIGHIKQDDLVYPACLFAWALMLFLPLKKIDRSEMITFFSYVAFFLSAAIAFFIVLPDMTLNERYPLSRHILMLFTAANIVALRWMVRNKSKPVQKVITEEGKIT